MLDAHFGKSRDREVSQDMVENNHGLHNSFISSSPVLNHLLGLTVQLLWSWSMLFVGCPTIKFVKDVTLISS